MSEFLNAAFALPTAFYSVTLLFVLAYWMLAIVGLFDLETADASVETGGEVDLDGPDLDVDLDGPDLDVDLDGPDLDMDLDGPDLDMDLDGPDLDMDLDGPDLDMDLDGPDLDMDLDGPDLDMDLDGPDLDVDLDGPDLDGPELDGLEGAAQSMSAFARIFSALGFHRVPLTVTISFIVFFGWVLCYQGMDSLAPLLTDSVSEFLAAAVVGVGSFFCAIPPASVAARPLAPVFHIHKASTRRSFVGQECEVLTGRVDDRFGQAEIADGGAGLTVQVRCDHDNALAKGGKALVVSFDDDREAYVIEPLNTPRGQRLQKRVEQIRAARQSRRARVRR